MNREERFRILGAETIAEIHRLVAAAPPPSPELLAELRPILAPALARVRVERATARLAADAR